MYFTISSGKIRGEKRLSASAKLLYGDLLVFMDEKGLFYDSIDVLPVSEIEGKSKIKRWLKDLEKNNYIKIHSENDIVQILKNKNMHGLGFGNKTCVWCGVKTSVLHSHHYPVPRSKGGLKTVDICPNCHHEFHFDQGYIEVLLNDKELIQIKKIKNEHLKADFRAKQSLAGK